MVKPLGSNLQPWPTEFHRLSPLSHFRSSRNQVRTNTDHVLCACVSFMSYKPWLLQLFVVFKNLFIYFVFCCSSTHRTWKFSCIIIRILFFLEDLFLSNNLIFPVNLLWGRGFLQLTFT